MASLVVDQFECGAKHQLPASVDSRSFEMSRSEVKCEAHEEEGEFEATVVKAERMVMEEVPVKLEREDDASAVQICGWPTPTASGDCKCVKVEENDEVGCVDCVSMYIKVEGSSEDADVELKEEKTESSMCGYLSSPAGVKSEGLPDFTLLGVDSLEMEQREQSSTSTAESLSVSADQWPRATSIPMASHSSAQVRQYVIFVEPAQLYLLQIWDSCPVGEHQTALKSNLSETRNVFYPEAGPQQDQSGKEVHLQSPIEAAHQEADTFSCPHCDFKSHLLRQKTRHVDQHHARKKSHLSKTRNVDHQETEEFSCPVCNFKSRLRSQLILHAKIAHESLRIQDFISLDHTSEENSPDEHVTSPVEIPPFEKVDPSLTSRCKSGKKGYQCILPARVDHFLQEIMASCSQDQHQSGKKGDVQSRGIVAHHNAKEFSCPHCYGKFPTDRNLKVHMKYDHVHVKKHRKKLMNRCRKNPPPKKPLHLYPKKYSCPHCIYRGCWKTNIQRHIKAVHEGARNFPCPHCDYRAAAKCTLLIHITAVHEQLRKYLCSHCGYRCTERGTLRRHETTVHEGLRKHQCPNCEFRASLRHHLNRHIQSVHESLKMYLCHYCGATYMESHRLRRHIKVNHEGS